MTDLVHRYLILPIWLGARGYTEIQDLKALEKSQWLISDEIEDMQWKQIRALLWHSWNNVPYYRKLMEQANVSPDELADRRSLECLPTIDKATINQHRDQLIAINISTNRHVPDSTSGSTGEPLRFLDDRKGLSRTQAAAWRSQFWVGGSFGSRHAYLWGSDFDVSAYEGFVGKIRSLLWNRLTLPAWRLSNVTAMEFLNTIQHYRPSVLVGYSGALYHWSRLLEFKRCTIPGLQGIIATAETLYDDWRVKIEDTFGVPVFNRYGARDLKMVAQECPEHKGLHITAENCYVEILNGNHIARPGELGEIVVTRLENWVMPFIRYRTGDLGVMSGQVCSCGRGLPILDNVQGRVQDAIYTPDGRVITGPFFGRLMRQCPEIIEYQVHQNSKDHLLIKVISAPPGILPSQKKIERSIWDYLGDDIIIDFEFVDEIPLTQSGKRRFIISHISH